MIKRKRNYFTRKKFLKLSVEFFEVHYFYSKYFLFFYFSNLFLIFIFVSLFRNTIVIVPFYISFVSPLVFNEIFHKKIEKWTAVEYRKDKDFYDDIIQYLTSKDINNCKSIKKLKEWFDFIKNKKFLNEIEFKKQFLGIFLTILFLSIFILISPILLNFKNEDASTLNSIFIYGFFPILIVLLIISRYLAIIEGIFNWISSIYMKIIEHEFDDLEKNQYKLIKYYNIDNNPSQIITNVNDQIDKVIQIFNFNILGDFIQFYGKLTSLHGKQNLLNFITLIHEYETFLLRINLQINNESDKQKIIELISYMDAIRQQIKAEIEYRRQMFEIPKQQKDLRIKRIHILIGIIVLTPLLTIYYILAMLKII